VSKIVIIRTPFVYPEKHVSSITAVPDVGTAYINGALERAGHDSFIIDAAGESIGTTYKIKNSHLEILGLPAEEIVKRIPKDIEMVGIQSMHSNRWIYDAHIVKMIIENFPKAKIFLGGEHVSACAEFILKQIPQIDACVIGEGEETVIELVDHLEKGLPLDSIKGLAFIDENKKVKFTERRKRFLDLDKLARPSWRNVPIQNYLDNHCGVNSLARKSITMVATRGCPFACTFCTVPNMWESKWYARPAHDVVDEIRTYVNKFKVNHIDFVDLTIVINKKWMTEFCNLLIAENLDLTWAIPIGTRTENLDSDLLVLMRKSGLTRVLYSAESGSDNTLEIINKKLNIQHFNHIVKHTSKLDICVKVALIFGFPGQRLIDVFDTFKLVNKLVFLGARDIVCLSFIPYPETKLYDDLDVEYDYNSLDNNIRLNNDIPNMKSWSEYFGDRTLKFFIWFFTLYFYALQGLVYPHRVIMGFYRVFIKKKPLTNFESIIYNMLFSGKPQSEEISINWQGPPEKEMS
jgi:radical SAM superfamily enzyme YgiQ (UPF0313 family)